MICSTNASDCIKFWLKQKRRLYAEWSVLQNKESFKPSMSVNHLARFKWLDQYVQWVEIWISCLTEDEAYVVQRHLVDSIDWARIATEYRHKWGQTHAKTDRTLMRLQTKALERIVSLFSIPSFLTDNEEWSSYAHPIHQEEEGSMH